MAALGHFGPTFDGEQRIEPGARGLIGFLGEHGHAGGALDARRGEDFLRFPGRFEIDPHRAGDGVGRPIEHQVGQQRVHAEGGRGIAAAIAPTAEFLDHPGSQPGRGIAEADTQRVRAGVLQMQIAGVVIHHRVDGGIGGGAGRGWGEGHVDVERDHLGRVILGQAGAQHGAQIAALHAVTRVAQHFGHQMVEGGGDAGDAPAGLIRLAAEAEAGDGGDHHIKAGRVRAAMTRRVGERADQFEEFEHRAGPAMQQQKRHRVGALAAHMEEMQIDAIDRGEKLRLLIEPTLLRAPIEAGAPVIAQGFQIGGVRTIGPAGAGNGGGPAGLFEPALEIGKHVIADRDLIGFHVSLLD